MRHWSEVVRQCYGVGWLHPMHRYHRHISLEAKPGSLVVDAGCGRDTPLSKVLHQKVRYVGLDRHGGVVSDLERIPLRSACADLIACKSVLEHLTRPQQVIQELSRVLKPGGQIVILTPNLWDITSLGAIMVPNALHPWIIRVGEGRPEADTFPTYYRANTERALRGLCRDAGLSVTTLDYWGQYPSVLQRWPRLFYFGCKLTKMLEAFENLRWLRGWIFMVAVKRR